MKIRTAALAVMAAVLTGCAGSGEPAIAVPGHEPGTGNISDLGVARTPVPEPPGPPADTIGDGTHELLRDIQAGKYRTAGPRPGGVGSCFWFRLNGTGGTPEEVTASGMIHGPTTITLWPFDKAFKSEFCQSWVRIGDTP